METEDFTMMPDEALTLPLKGALQWHWVHWHLSKWLNMTNERRVSLTEPVDVFMMKTGDPRRIPDGVTEPLFYRITTRLFLVQWICFYYHVLFRLMLYSMSAVNYVAILCTQSKKKSYSCLYLSICVLHTVRIESSWRNSHDPPASSSKIQK